MKSKLGIEEVQIVLIKPTNGLIGFASCVTNGQFYIGNIAIYTSLSKPGEYRLTYPTKKLSSGKQLPCIHPINKETEAAIQEAIIAKYKKLIEEVIENDEKAQGGA